MPNWDRSYLLCGWVLLVAMVGEWVYNQRVLQPRHVREHAEQLAALCPDEVELTANPW